MSTNLETTRYRLGDELRLAAKELRPLGDRVSADLDSFLAVHDRYVTKATEHEAQVNLVRLCALARLAHRAVLVEALQEGWDLVPSVGVHAVPKPSVQVEQERMLLFPSGRPTAKTPGDHALVLGTDALVSALTTDSALARAWPAENLASILSARDAFVPAWEEWKQASYRRSVLLTELEPLRKEWQKSLGLLRDEVKRAFREQELPNRFVSLFRYRKASKAPEPPSSP